MNKSIKQQLLLTNTLSGKKELFEPRTPGNVLMYVCGITPYDHAHIGHGRCSVTFDVLYRLLNYLGYTVTYARNFTDVDDKLLNRAAKEYGDYMRYGEVAQRYIDSFTADVSALNCLRPTVEPRVTQVIADIITFVQGLIDKGHAYVVDGDVYYAVRSFPTYGKLSKRSIDDLQVGARVEVNEKKHDPLDFALWKAEPEGQFWKSPWGYGRPGWHIECSAMAAKFLGPHIDIHGGGMDLIFPHHENEIAQSEGLHNGERFARYWMHNAFVQINKEKMSKSLGNFFTLKQVFEQFDPQVVRFYYLNHNYTIPLEFSFEGLQAAQKTYKRLCIQFDRVQPVISDEQDATVKAMVALLCDDLNGAGAFGVLFDRLNTIKDNEKSLAAIKGFMQQVMGLTLAPLAEKTVEMTPEIAALLEQREQARKAKDWKKADELRDQLRKLGFDVADKKL